MPGRGVTELRTRQLRGRPPHPTDGARYDALLRAPEVTAWLRPPPLPPFDDASVAEVLDRDLRLWEARGSGPWQLDLADGTPAGRAGLAASTIGGEDVVELVWTITPTLWGRGLATEAGTAALATAATLGVGEVVAVTLPANRASQRVMEKLGLRWDGDVIHAGLPHVRYRSGAIRSTPRGARG